MGTLGVNQEKRKEKSFGACGNAHLGGDERKGKGKRKGGTKERHGKRGIPYRHAACGPFLAHAPL